MDRHRCDLDGERRVGEGRVVALEPFIGIFDGIGRFRYAVLSSFVLAGSPDRRYFAVNTLLEQVNHRIFVQFLIDTRIEPTIRSPVGVNVSYLSYRVLFVSLVDLHDIP